MDLIDTVSANTTADSVVKLSLSDLFRRKYSSLTDVLSNLFRSNLKAPPTVEERKEQTLKVTQLLAEECAPDVQNSPFALFAIDCTANPRLYANKVKDRSIVHAPNHVPGQKPITAGHEYSVLVHLPNRAADRNLHWVVPLSIKRVESDQSGPKVGLSQLEEISNQTVFKNYFCVNVADAAYSTKGWVIGVSKLPHVVQVARMRGNRKLFHMPPQEKKTKRGRPQMYGEEFLLKSPSQPDLEEITTTTNRKGNVRHVLLERWNDLIMRGSQEERTHKHPFDLLRVTVTDKKGKPVYKRPLWVMIAGTKRRDVSSKEAYTSYGRRYDIEHFFRFGKQRLGLVNFQTPETRHEENWHWVAMLAYNMLYHSRQLAKPTAYPWEKKKVEIVASIQRPSQVQRDYKRIIQGIGTPAPIPKPRGKSPGRKPGDKIGERPNSPLVRKSIEKTDPEPSNHDTATNKKGSSVLENPKRRRTPYRRMQKVWSKSRPPPMRC